MIAYLAEILGNLFEAQDAYIDFRILMMKEDESFSGFYICFLYLASISRLLIDNL